MMHNSLRLLPILLLLLVGACSPGMPAMTDDPVEASTAATPAVDGTATMVTSSPMAAPATATLLPAATPTVELTVEATAASVQETATPPPSPTSDPPEQQVISGQTADGAFFLGAHEAPLTVIDYSDFL